MTNFKTLKFKPHKFNDTGGFQGVHATIKFPNGRGASVVRFTSNTIPACGSYGAHAGLYELAVLKGDELDYETMEIEFLSNDVIGYVDENRITEILQQIERLPAAA
jgi:hypothetical protein